VRFRLLAATILCSLCTEAPAADRYSILLYTHAPAWVHPSIPIAVEAITSLGARNGFGVVASDDPNIFSSKELSKYAAVVFVHTSGDSVPAAPQRQALEQFIRGGGGYLGVHAAADLGDVQASWPWYRDLVGAVMKGHTINHIWADKDPKEPTWIYEGAIANAPADAEVEGTLLYTTWVPARVKVEDMHSPAMSGWGSAQTRTDEWYGFVANPRPQVHVLASVNEDTYDPYDGDMGPGAADHPIAWCHAYDGGRAVYTAMGHTIASWSEPLFLSHIKGAIEMAAGAAAFNCAAEAN
jgi:type 1 glutamine amidotransferase